MKRLLLATDGSEHALKASEYLVHLYQGASDVEVTLLHISPPVPPLYREGRHDPQIRKVYAIWKKRKEQEAKNVIGEVAEVLQRGGFKKSQIKAKYFHQIVGIARDILREVDAGQYDACVIGKKGMGWFDDMFLGSITNKLLEISENHPIWLVSGERGNCRRVLIAMDHTAQAVQLAGYVGKLFQEVEGVKICFYHYCAPFTEELTREERALMKEVGDRIVEDERKKMTHFFGEAQKVLEGLGFDKKGVEYQFDLGKSTSPRGITQKILKVVEEGKYGTLVIGRKGSTGAREFRLGSVTMRIANMADRCAVWVI